MRKNLILGTMLAVLLILSIPLISGSTISSEKEILSKKESINDKPSDSYCILLRAQLDFLEGLIRSLIKYFEEQEIDGVVNILNSMIDAFEKTYEEKCGDSSEYQDSSSTLKEFEQTILETKQYLNLIATRYSSNILITQQIQEINSASNQILNTISGVTVSESSVSGQCPLCALSR